VCVCVCVCVCVGVCVCVCVCVFVCGILLFDWRKLEGAVLLTLSEILYGTIEVIVLFAWNSFIQAFI